MGCDSAAKAPELNSERILARYGSYGVDVLQASDSQRISSLYSLDVVPQGGAPAANTDRPTGAGKTTRTLAVVSFDQPTQPAVAGPHKAILAGGSIGATFRDEGWRIEKQHLLLCELMLDASAIPGLEDMRIELPATLALHRYRFTVEKNGIVLDYAIIEEIHHPDYLGLAELRQIYPAPALPNSAATADKLSVCSITL